MMSSKGYEQGVWAMVSATGTGGTASSDVSARLVVR
jgi:hypothetical protein